MFCEMDPPAGESVKTMSPSLWTLGTMMICVKTSPGDSQPSESLASWVDGDSTFHIRRRDRNDSPKSDGGDTAVDRLQVCGTGGALWKLGGEAICKVKGWCEGRQLEATTISFVREHIPQVPLPDILYSWIDAPINRTFLIMRCVHSPTLGAAWPHLSVAQRQNIAKEVAHHCTSMARWTSSKYASISGGGVLEYWLMGKPPASNPTWLPMTLGPLSVDEMKAYLLRISSETPPEIGNDFVFYHPDLGPTNIMVTEDGNHLSAIIDWEAAAFFPRFWVATRPASNWAFNLQGETPDEKKGWSKLLVNELQARGFHVLNEEFTKWRGAVTGEA